MKSYGKRFVWVGIGIMTAVLIAVVVGVALRSGLEAASWTAVIGGVGISMIGLAISWYGATSGSPTSVGVRQIARAKRNSAVYQAGGSIGRGRSSARGRGTTPTVDQSAKARHGSTIRQAGENIDSTSDAE